MRTRGEQNSSGSGKRIETVHCLRGLAALAVCWFHFTFGHAAFFSSYSLISRSGTYGWLGVEVFFVISGFILPYALHTSRYRLSFTSYRLFLAKRIVRLEPPYLATIALVIVLGYLSAAAPGYQGSPMVIKWPALAAHFGYLAGILNFDWLNPVFWTLGIEFQFYLSIGLLYPLISSSNRMTRLATQCALLALALIPTRNVWIPYYLFLFVAGITTFQARVKLSKPRETIFFLTICAIGAGWRIEPVVAAIGRGTAAAILLVEWQHRILRFLGTVSYSLYLVHIPVGGRVINLADRHSGGLLYHLVVLAAALAAAITASYLMYRFIEHPSQAYAGQIKLRRTAEASGGSGNLQSAQASTG